MADQAQKATHVILPIELAQGIVQTLTNTNADLVRKAAANQDIIDAILKHQAALETKESPAGAAIPEETQEAPRKGPKKTE